MMPLDCTPDATDSWSKIICKFGNVYYYMIITLAPVTFVSQAQDVKTEFKTVTVPKHPYGAILGLLIALPLTLTFFFECLQLGAWLLDRIIAHPVDNGERGVVDLMSRM